MNEHDKISELELKKNGEGYSDPTAYQAIKNIESKVHSQLGIPSSVLHREVSDKLVEIHKKAMTPVDEDEARFRSLLTTIFKICELADFHLEGRIEVTDKRTGKVWR